ncbi:MAG: hypothetical protein QOE92_460 [Chloroflexota bacterium]|nr:hypothetical protein [Chloroflexota bacterium]
MAYRLNAEVRALEQENARIEAANRAYQEQLAAVSRPDGAEEQARLHNYAKPDEHVYVIAASPGAAPSPRPTPTPDAPPTHDSTGSPGFWGDLWGALTTAFRS